MTRHVLSGVYAAALTPLQADFSPDLEAVAPFLAFLASRGCHGALLFGTTGEGPSFSSDEREAVWRAALKIREQVPDFRLFAGTGTPSLNETVNLTRLAFDIGYDAVVTLPPYYFRNASDDGLFAWFEQVIHKAVPQRGRGRILNRFIDAFEGILSDAIRRHQGFFSRSRAGQQTGRQIRGRSGSVQRD